ncbi:hypothetical protein ACR9E3_29705 [Actinomycetospora sp. C-140]
MTDFVGAPTPGPGRDPGPVGKIILLLLWLVLAVLPIVAAIGDLRLATGAIGTPGTLTVEQCTDLGRGRYDCTGRFAPDGGGPPVAVDASPDSTAGDVRPAQLTPEGDRAVPAGTAGILAALTLPFLGLFALGFVPAIGLWATGSRRSKRPAVAGGVVIGVVSVIGIVVGLVAAYS